METTTFTDTPWEFPGEHDLLKNNYHKACKPNDQKHEALSANLEQTKHGAVRMQQRSFTEEDVNLIYQCGTMIGDDEFFMSNKDADREIRALKKGIKRIDRLRNRLVIVSGLSVVTSYRCSTSKLSRLRRRSCQKN